MKDIFTKIIQTGQWDRGSPCGSGSTVQYTEQLRKSLENFIKESGIRSMFDAPCGDHAWMNLVKFPKDFDYVGGDIVDFLIKDNQRRYPHRRFVQFDITKDVIPKTELLFCRDCLFHFSWEDMQRAFDNIARGGAQWIMTTSYLPGRCRNSRIRTGEFTPIRLERAPFNFPEPVYQLPDGPMGEIHRTMSIWSRESFNRKIVIRDNDNNK